MKPKGFWTYERCVNEVCKYKTRQNLKKYNGTVYRTILKNKWTEIFDNYLTYSKLPNNFWTKEKCIEIAKNYIYRSDFKKNEKKCYSYAQSKKWLDEICNHMCRKSTPFKRIVYQYQFSSNVYYVGLTCQPVKRNIFHLTNNKSSVYKLIKKNNDIPKYSIISNGFVDYKTASELETETILKLKELGYELLNKNNGGSLGGVFKKWDKSKCIDVLSKCKNVSEFIKKYPGAYNFSKKINIFEEIKEKFTKRIKDKGFWSFEKCYQEGQKYKHRVDFQKNSSSAYVIAHKNKWLDKICKHMIKKQGSGFKSKFVNQYTLDGKLIKKWSSINEAKNELKINHISAACGGKLKTAGGYKWLYDGN